MANEMDDPRPAPTAGVQAWRTQRVAVHWDARYRLSGTARWFRCRVVDVSMSGVGLMLCGRTEDPFTSVVVELRPPNRARGVVVHGEVRYTSADRDGGRRVGVEFVNVGAYEERSLRELICRHLPFESASDGLDP